VIALDTPVSKYLPQLATPLRYIASVDDSGQPAYGSTNAEITVLMLMNQVSRPVSVAWLGASADRWAPGVDRQPASVPSSVPRSPLGKSRRKSAGASLTRASLSVDARPWQTPFSPQVDVSWCQR